MTEHEAFPADPTMVPFWEGARRGELLIQRCTSCGAHQFYARPFCTTCEGETEWVAASGRGTVYSKTRVLTLQPLPNLSPPYDVLLVELDEGPRLLSSRAQGDCGIGDRVEVYFEPRDHAPPLPQFRPLAGE